MSSLTGESIDSFARQLGAKRLRLEFPWEQQPLKDVFSGFSSEISVFQPPDWIDQPPVKLSTAASVGATDEKHFGFKHARMRLSQISWTGSENKRLHFALQCWKVIVLGSTTHTSLGRKLLDYSELERSEDEIYEVLQDVFSRKATKTLRHGLGLLRCWLSVVGKDAFLESMVAALFLFLKSWPIGIFVILGGTMQQLPKGKDFWKQSVSLKVCWVRMWRKS